MKKLLAKCRQKHEEQERQRQQADDAEISADMPQLSGDAAAASDGPAAARRALPRLYKDKVKDDKPKPGGSTYVWGPIPTDS